MRQLRIKNYFNGYRLQVIEGAAHTLAIGQNHEPLISREAEKKKEGDGMRKARS